MGTFDTNRIHSVGRMVKVADRMRWGFAPARVQFPLYLKCKIHQTPYEFENGVCINNLFPEFVC